MVRLYEARTQVSAAPGVFGHLHGVVACEAVEFDHGPDAIVVETLVRGVAVAHGVGLHMLY